MCDVLISVLGVQHGQCRRVVELVADGQAQVGGWTVRERRNVDMICADRSTRLGHEARRGADRLLPGQAEAWEG